MLSAQKRQRRGRRAEQLDRRIARRYPRQLLRRLLDEACIRARDDQRGETPVRRPAAGAAVLGLERREPFGVALGQGLEHFGLGLVSLQQHAAGMFGAAGAARHLAEQLERAFGGAQVPAGQAEIGVDHAH